MNEWIWNPYITETKQSDITKDPKVTHTHTLLYVRPDFSKKPEAMWTALLLDEDVFM